MSGIYGRSKIKFVFGHKSVSFDVNASIGDFRERYTSNHWNQSVQSLIELNLGVWVWNLLKLWISSQLVRIGLQSSLELDSAGPVSSYNLQQLPKFQPSFLLEYVLSLNSLYIGEAVCWSPPATFFSADNAGHGQVQLLSNSEPWAFE